MKDHDEGDPASLAAKMVQDIIPENNQSEKEQQHVTNPRREKNVIIVNKIEPFAFSMEQW